MKVTGELVLSFLLNASWQIALVVAFTTACDWLLRGTAARYRHRRRRKDVSTWLPKHGEEGGLDEEEPLHP